MDAPQPRSTNTPDRRRKRRSVSMSGYIVRDGGISHAVQLTDLNYGGCGIETSVELLAGEALRLAVLDRGSIAAKVCWCCDGSAGLEFSAVTSSGRRKTPRRAGRISVDAEVSLKTLGRSNYRVRVHDLSTDGCKVDLVERPSEGDRMLIKFEGLESLEADVCWVDGFTAGLMFNHRLHPAVFDLLLTRLA